MEQQKIFVYEQVAGKVYLRIDELASKYKLDKRTVRSRMDEIESNAGKGKRYRDISVLHDGNIVLVNELVFLDWLKYRRAVQKRIPVPEFTPSAWVEYQGYFTLPRKEIET